MTPDDLRAFITSPMMAAPGNLGTFYKGWKQNGPEATAASLRQTIAHLLPNSDSTGLSIGRLAYWSNDLLRDALQARPGPVFVELEHAEAFLWAAFCHLLQATW